MKTKESAVRKGGGRRLEVGDPHGPLGDAEACSGIECGWSLEILLVPSLTGVT